MRTVIFILLCISFSNCNQKSENLKTEVTDSLTLDKRHSTQGDGFDYQKLENYLVEDETDTAKFQVINFDCAVLIYPTEKQIEEMKKGNEEDFSTIADDAMFYQYETSKYLGTASIKTISASQKELLKFVGHQQSWTLNVRAANRSGWNIIFFKRNKSPKIFGSFALVQQEIKNYFED